MQVLQRLQSTVQSPVYCLVWYCHSPSSNHKGSWVQSHKQDKTSKLGFTCKKSIGRVVCFQYPPVGIHLCPGFQAFSRRWPKPNTLPHVEKDSQVQRESLATPCCGSWAPWQLVMLWRRPRGTKVSHLWFRHWQEQKTQVLVPGFRAILIFWLQSNVQYMNA